MRLPTRYEVVEESVRHAFARDLVDKRDVVVKELALGRISDWKELDLFRRETDVLRQLDHPAIPDFVDTFEGEGETPTFYLVCEKMPGVGLLDVSLDETRLIDIARRVLEVLDYLHRFDPPVVHRNITPEAIVVDDDDVFLVDFGSVQVELQATVGGSTVVGTSGYMAPEQLLGRAVPGSDLYSLGATLVRVLTNMDPAELPTRRMRLQWRDHAEFGSDTLFAWIDRMIEPDPTQRFQSASEALLSLGRSDHAIVVASSAILNQRPTGTRVELEHRDHKLTVRVPRPPLMKWVGWARIAAFSLLAALLAFLAQLFVAADVLPQAALVLFALGLSALVAFQIYRYRQAKPSDLVLDVDKGFRLRAPDGSIRSGRYDDVVTVQSGHAGRADAIWLHTEEDVLEIGRGLKRAEIDWIRDEVGAFLDRD